MAYQPTDRRDDEAQFLLKHPQPNTKMDPGEHAGIARDSSYTSPTRTAMPALWHGLPGLGVKKMHIVHVQGYLQLLPYLGTAARIHTGDKICPVNY